MSHSRDPATEDWINRARGADLWAVLNQVAPHHAVKPRARRGCGPCPVCGGKDRFSIDGVKGLFLCRKSAVGGDAIALVQYVTGANFLGAVEIITGEGPPKREQRGEVRRADPALIEQRRIAAAAAAEDRARAEHSHREEEIARARDIWHHGVPIGGTAAEDYLRLRGIQAPVGARLRFHRNLKFWQYSDLTETYVVLHEGPALLARIDDAAHRFTGCHCTYLDLAQPKGKAVIADPETGEILPAKKVRGSQKGGHIHLGGEPFKASHLYMGEGIETTLSVREALLHAGADLAGLLFWASVNLGNLGGPAADRVNHHTQTRSDSKGRIRRLKVPGPTPLIETDQPVLLPPNQVTEITLLGDGDSDRFSTEQVLRRAAARFAAPGRTIKAAWPGAGKDFNDLRMAECETEEVAA